MTITECETILGKRWNEWTQAEWDEVLKTTEASDLKFPLIINKVMEAYMAKRHKVLTHSVIAFVQLAIQDSDNRKAENELEWGKNWNG